MPISHKDRLQNLQAASKLRYYYVEPAKVVKLTPSVRRKKIAQPKGPVLKPAKTKLNREINWDLVKKWASRG